MAKPAQLKAVDLHRNKPHKIPSPPTKIAESKLRESEWRVSKTKPAKKGRTKKSGKTAVVKAPKRASSLLRCQGGKFTCLHSEFPPIPIDLPRSMLTIVQAASSAMRSPAGQHAYEHSGENTSPPISSTSAGPAHSGTAHSPSPTPASRRAPTWANTSASCALSRHPTRRTGSRSRPSAPSTPKRVGTGDVSSTHTAARM